MDNTTNTPAEISATILQQIGGRRALVMMGVRQTTYSAGGLTSIRIKGSRTANTLRITLDADDTYTLEVLKITGGRISRKTGAYSDIKERTVFKGSMLYAEDLRPAIESHTGLYLSL